MLNIIGLENGMSSVRHTKMQQHIQAAHDRHSFQNISLYLLIMPKKAKGIPDAHTSDFFIL